jgi:ADP-heptose:LPS heptosyltransferase
MLARYVLVFHQGALGDFVVSWPLALALTRLHPQSRVVYVTQAGKGKLAERSLRIESTDADTGGWHQLFADGFDPAALPDQPKKLLTGAHSIYSFVAGANDVWTSNVRAAAPAAAVTNLSPRPPDGADFDGPIHAWIERQLEAVPVRTAYQQILKSVQTRGCGYKRSPDGAVALHPGSGSPKKNWASRHFVQLARKLVKQRHRVRVLIGEVEREQLDPHDLEHFKAIAEVVEPKDYVDLLQQIGFSDALVCNDTGPGHLAAAIGTPTISLFGPDSDAARWKPLGPHVTLLRGEKSLDEIDVDSVVKAVDAATGR